MFAFRDVRYQSLGCKIQPKDLAACSVWDYVVECIGGLCLCIMGISSNLSGLV